MELATALHHSAQRVEALSEGVEGEKYYAPLRPKPPLPGMRPAPLEEVAEQQEKLGQHRGIGYEFVLAFDVLVLQMVEQPADASALAFFEEEEAKVLEVEYLELARSASSHDSIERLREVVRRMHVHRQKGRGRKKKKRRKKRLPRSPRPRLVSGCCLRSTRPRPRLLRTAWFYSGYKFLPRSRRQVVQFPVVTQRLVPWSRLFVGPQGFSSSSPTRCSMPCCAGRAGRRHPGRGAEADSHGLACWEDHGDSTVAVCFLVVDAAGHRRLWTSL